LFNIRSSPSTDTPSSRRRCRSKPGSSAEDLVTRDAKHYEASDGRTLCIAQIETVGDTLLERRTELLDAMRDVRERRSYVSFALMLTDIQSKGTTLLVCEEARVDRALDAEARDGAIELPGVMSRKKQLAPKLLRPSERDRGGHVFTPTSSMPHRVLASRSG
jgi:inorganic pyrophosphatase/exopolyphosphatase